MLDNLAEAVTAAAAQRPSVADAPLALVQLRTWMQSRSRTSSRPSTWLMSEDAYALGQVRTPGCVFVGRASG